MKERIRSSGGKEKDYETFPKLSKGDVTLVSTSRARLFGRYRRTSKDYEY